MTIHQKYMHRCLELAKQAAGYVAPNPMVGALLIYQDRIIGEGYHQKFGEAHAEVNCLNSVKETDRQYISQATLYVSLEPCNHFGKTPPCTGLVIKNKIPKVIIGCRDANKIVDGRGVEKLRAAGIEVELANEVLEKECREINKRFFTFHEQQRPYVILKWAETGNRKISANEKDRLFISNEKTNRLVHKWRSEEASILVGPRTALLDDPELTNRYWNAPSPVRLLLDMDLKLPATLKIFNQEQKTIVFNSHKQEEKENLQFVKIDKNKNLVQQLLQSLYKLNMQSVLVEGGARLLQSFIDENAWDEIRVIKNEKLLVTEGLAAPSFPLSKPVQETRIADDLVITYIRS